MHTSSSDEVRHALKGVAHRFKLYGFAGPLLYHTDDCCHEHAMLSEVFETLRDSRVQVGIEANVPCLTLPQPVQYLRRESDVRAAFGDLQVDVNDGTLGMVGFDLEWPAHDKTAKVSTLQIGRSDGRAYVVAMHELTRIPLALRTFLEDDKVIKVGKKIFEDVARFFKDYGLVVNGVLDLAHRAKELRLVTDARIGLDAMCRRFLSRCIPGKTSVRLSDWSQTPLSAEQLEYAGVDAYAGALLMDHFEENALAETVPSSVALRDGVDVRVLNKGGGRVAAIGRIDFDTGTPRVVIADQFPVRITAVTVPGTLLMYPSPNQNSFKDINIGDTVLWDRRRLRLLPPSWSIDAHIHLVGRRWSDPNPEDGGDFVIIGITHGEEGVRVEYIREDADEGDDSEESMLDEVLRWLDGDFSEGASAGDADAAMAEASVPPAEGDGDGGDMHEDEKSSAVGDEDDEKVNAAADDDRDDRDIFQPPEGVDYGNDNDEDENGNGAHDECDFIGPIPCYDRDDYDGWRTVRIKLDALHAPMRFERSLRKTHGAYKHFMSRLCVIRALSPARARAREWMYARAMQRGYLGNGFELMCVTYSDACVRVRREQKCEWFRVRARARDLK